MIEWQKSMMGGSDDRYQLLTDIHWFQKDHEITVMDRVVMKNRLTWGNDVTVAILGTQITIKIEKGRIQ